MDKRLGIIEEISQAIATPIMKPIKYSAKTFFDNRGWLKKLQPINDLVDDDFPISFDDFYLSMSNRHVFRGFHFQEYPHPQAKLIRVISGSITSYMLNLDRESDTFQKLYSFELSSTENAALLCPPMHGNAFLSMQDNTVIAVLASGKFCPSSEVVINPFSVNELVLPKDMVLSTKDADGVNMVEYVSSALKQ